MYNVDEDISEANNLAAKKSWKITGAPGNI
jgi:hypothetical protein